MSFTHLQVRSGYSLMNSTLTIEKLVKKASDLEFAALALTDEEVLYGVIPFYKVCRKAGIKPLIGMIAYVAAADGRKEPCILLAKNNHGYQNLIKLSTYIQKNNANGITKDIFPSYTGDLIGILPAVSGKIEAILSNQNYDKLNAYISEWGRFFADGDFYIGIQDHGLENERKIREDLKVFHENHPLQVAVLQDVRYVDENDAIAYGCLLAMKNDKRWTMTMDDPSVNNRHLRSAAEMEELFQSYWPDALKETENIAKKCNVMFDFDQHLLPSFPVPEQMDAHQYLRKICWSNIEQRYVRITEEISERLTYELDIIQSMQFSDYFLIVWDLVAYAKKEKIMVGPGRGSAAGSLVAYVLGITDVDPIEYGLLFERFLNPERVSMPDIDIDFSDNRRDDMIAYARNKYGAEHVAQIITFGTFQPRSLLRELIKTIGIDQQDASFILKEIPIHAKKSVAVHVKESDALTQYIKESPKLKTLFRIAAKLEGLPRHMSTHAAGIVISEQPLVEHVPLTIGSGETDLTQYSMNDLESIGLLKMDLLGLRNLTILEKIIESIHRLTGSHVKLSSIPENDPDTYALLQKGKTNGIFQLESGGMKEVLVRLMPTSFEDIVAVNALFRPGPMEYIPVYINRKHKKEKTHYPHPDLTEILEKTYGVLIYQEQIMQIAHKIAGFSLGKADLLRRAVSKKQQHIMDEQREAFIEGCHANGYSRLIAEEIFAWIVKFSNYGFNRSHAVAYSMISYQLAFLKAHYPAVFFTELLSSVANQKEKAAMYIKEARDLGIRIAPPSINKSFGKYTAEENVIRMGLISIKGIGNQVMKEIIHARKSGPFASLFDFCLRVSPKTINRQVMETLVMAGTFDDIFANRASLLASIDQAIDRGELFREFQTQPNLFPDQIGLEAAYTEIEDFSMIRKLADEKELIGMYVSSHPLKNFKEKLQMNGYVSLKEAQRLIGKSNVKSAAIIQTIKTIRTKRGDPMAFITLSDEDDDMEAVVFPELYRNVRRWLKEEMMLFIMGKIESRNNRVQWLLSDLKPFDGNELKIKREKRLFIRITELDSEASLKKIKALAQSFPGNTPVYVHHDKTKKTYKLSNVFIQATDRCMRQLIAYFGEKCVVLEQAEISGQ